MHIPLEEMRSRLLQGGVDLVAFNKWRKNENDLFEEISSLDVTLDVAWVPGLRPNVRRPRVVRTALNVKALIESRLGYLCEVGRTFTNNGERVRRFSPWGFSETRKRGETPLETFQRGIWQEHGVEITPKLLVHANGPDEKAEHESSVYWQVLSVVWSQYGHFRREEPTHDETPIRDGSALIHVRWFKPEELSSKKKAALMLARAKCFPIPTNNKGLEALQKYDSRQMQQD